MHTRTALISVVVVLTFTISAFVTAPVRAAVQHSAVAPARPAAVSELAKVTLSDTSVNAPGFAVDAQQGIGAVIAWAGTDSLHRINLMTSSDGLHYDHKLTLSETTINRPAVAREPASAGGAVALAWRGTDSFHTLNVLYDPYGVHGQPQHLVTAQTSFTTPAIAFFQGKLLAGIHPKVVSEMLGHSSVTITLTIYSHVLPMIQRDAALAMDRILRDQNSVE